MASVRYRPMEVRGISRSDYGGPTRISSLGGARILAALSFTPIGQSTADQERARRRLIAALAGAGGAENGLYVSNAAAQAKASFAELVASATFAAGIGSDLTVGSQFAGAVTDRMLRLTRTANDGGTDGLLRLTNPATVTANAVYIGRVMVMPGRGPSTGLQLRFGSTSFGTEYGSVSALSAGMLTFACVPLGSSLHFAILQTAVGGIAGDYVEIPLFSLARGGLADCGANEITHSAEFEHADWFKQRSSVTANATTAYDGTATGDKIVEDNTATATHYVSQTKAKGAGDEEWTAHFVMKSAERTEGAVRIGAASSNFGQIVVDLSNGSILGVTASGSITNPRGAVDAKGDGWYDVAISATIPAALSTCLGGVMPSVAGSPSYSGNGTSGIYVCESGLAPGAVPIRRSTTTTAAISGGTPASKTNALYLKGLPPSATIAYAGQEIEIVSSLGSEFKFLTAPIVTDGHGRGYAQFMPRLRGTVSDNAPVVFYQPFGHFLYAGEFPGFAFEPGVVMSELELEEGP